MGNSYLGMKTRKFLKWSGLGAAVLAAALFSGPASAEMHGSPPVSRVATPAPAHPTDFVNPLLKPSLEGSVLGIYRPEGQFTITAQPAPAAAQILPGTLTDLLVYGVESDRGTLVNPVLWMEKGQQVNTRLINALDQPTIIHWHGLIVDGKNDGGPLSAGIDAVLPGGEYDYSYQVLNRGGTYWYHPHPFAVTSEQAYRGLASFYIVDDADEKKLRSALDLSLGETDIPIVIQDKRFDMENQLVYKPTEEEWFMGYLGDTILANLTPKAKLDVGRRIYRFRLLNGSTARIYKLAFVKGTKKLPFSIIGTDGGLLARPYAASEVFLAPGERVDVLLDLSRAARNDEIFLKSLQFDPMDNEGGMSTATTQGDPMTAVPPNGAELHIMKLQVNLDLPSYTRRIPQRLSTITPIRVKGAATRRIRLSQDMMNMRWLINGANYNDDPSKFLFDVKKDSVEIWEITNDMMSMPHPMHIHGFEFQVLSRRWMGMGKSPWAGLLGPDGLLPTDKGWKDTVLLWPGETVRVAIDFSHDFPGAQEYVFHCHNLEHEEQGMMINYRVK
jgi:blue copper oxidase